MLDHNMFKAKLISSEGVDSSKSTPLALFDKDGNPIVSILGLKQTTYPQVFPIVINESTILVAELDVESGFYFLAGSVRGGPGQLDNSIGASLLFDPDPNTGLRLGYAGASGATGAGPLVIPDISQEDVFGNGNITGAITKDAVSFGFPIQFEEATTISLNAEGWFAGAEILSASLSAIPL